MKSSTSKATLSPELTVNQVVERIPSAVTVFARHGVDTCCGGDLSVSEAARRHGLDADELLREVEKTTGG